MTNNSGMTITSTASAPVGCGSTSMEDSTIPLPMAEGINAHPRRTHRSQLR